MAEFQEDPLVVRPIPRRPLDLNRTGPTPPEDEDLPLPSSEQHHPSALNLDSLNSRLLNTRSYGGSEPNSASGTLSRAQSIMNLSSGTLFGIYSPTVSGPDRFYGEQDEPSTPWGTGAETPGRVLSEFEPNYEIRKERGRLLRRRSLLHPIQRVPQLSQPVAALYLCLRAFLLFGLGILYGTLVARFQDGHKVLEMDNDDRVQLTMYDWRYMAFWGVSGVALGGLLPWFDSLWEEIFGEESGLESQAEHTMGRDKQDLETDADWALVVRGIGAFVGIVFAIRKLPWASTLQVSLTLALVNPFLWYLIDRSRPGFVLSAALALAGSAVLMGFNPDMVPTPPSRSSFVTYSAGNASRSGELEMPMFLGGLASQETIETGIWTLSVLFCCCVCFGNIGRRLALNRNPSSKGLWVERKL